MRDLFHYLLVAVFAVLFGPALAFAEVEDPIESGRDALGPFPWYDADADDVRPLRAREVDERDYKPRDYDRNDRDSSDRGGVSMPSGGSLFAGAEVIAWVVVGLIVAGLVALLIYAILQYESPERKKGKVEMADVDLDALPVPVAAGDTDLLAEARRLYERGEFARAMIYLYSHMLLRLDRGNFIRLAKGKTNRQYLREVRSRRPMAEFFELAMHKFEAAFFGRRDLARDEFEAAWRGVDSFHRMIDEASA